MFTGELRGFQQEAFDQMLDTGALLVAATMGSGKTVMTIAVLEELFESNEVECGLVVVPASLKEQWAEEIDEFTDYSRVMLIDGSPAVREDQYARAHRYEYIIVNYEQVTNDWEYIAALPLDFVVCDEVQAIKNFKAQRSQLVKRLQVPWRFGLTGTAVENRPEELFSIMEWVDADLLGSFHVFDNTFIDRNRFGSVDRYKNLDLLHKRMLEGMFRRSFEDIKDQLPTVVSLVRTVPMPRKVEALYDIIVDDLLTELDSAQAYGNFDLSVHYGKGGDASPAELAQRGRVMSRLTCLRMLADHPRLLQESAARYNQPDSDTGSAYAAELLERGVLLPITTPAAKFSQTVSLISDLLEEAEENKVVLFSFFVDTLDWFSEVLDTLGVGSVVYSGRLSRKQKDAARKKFLSDPNVKVFLASDAGGTGLNLPVANYLINYDLPWSAGQLQQRNARIQRLSSEFPHIHVIDMLSKGTVEVRQHAILTKRRALGSAIMDGIMDENATLPMDDIGTLKKFLEANL